MGMDINLRQKKDDFYEHDVHNWRNSTWLSQILLECLGNDRVESDDELILNTDDLIKIRDAHNKDIVYKIHGGTDNIEFQLNVYKTGLDALQKCIDSGDEFKLSICY